MAARWSCGERRAAMERPSERRRHAVEVRPARPADLEAVVDIERGAFSDPWHREAFAAALARPEVFFRVAVAGGAAGGAPTGGIAAGTVVGYVLAWFVVEEGEVANIAVRPECRGRGVGASLLDATLDAARRRGTTAMFLEVRASNEPAQSLYASRGFRQVGRRRAYYRSPVEDALLLKWEPGPGDG